MRMRCVTVLTVSDRYVYTGTAAAVLVERPRMPNPRARVAPRWRGACSPDRALRPRGRDGPEQQALCR